MLDNRILWADTESASKENFLGKSNVVGHFQEVLHGNQEIERADVPIGRIEGKCDSV